MACALIGTLAASGNANATWQDQTQAAGPGHDAVRKPAAAQHRPASHQLRAHGVQQVAAPGRPQGAGNHRRGRIHASAAGSGGISCVPYARAVTGIEVSGNGGDWWGNATGHYDRGQQPEPGAVMAFQADRGMSRGHVAVVRQVLNSREVLIDHANWGGPGIRRGSVMQNVTVVDVSNRNDWSAVKVQSGYSGEAFGRTYPTHGFIYNRPDDGRPNDGRPNDGANTSTAYAGTQLRRSVRYEQMADAPEAASSRGYSPQGLSPSPTAQAASLQTHRR